VYKNKRVLAIIPARGRSKRIPHKNRKLLNGKPLITYTIEQAQRSQYIDTIVISSDDNRILDCCRNYNCLRQKRPTHLAQDDTSTVDVLRYVLTKAEKKQGPFEIIITLQPTSPFRTTESIDKCITTIVDKKKDTVFTVTEATQHPGIMFTEDLSFKDKESFFNKGNRKRHYILNGAVWATTKETLLNSGIYGENVDQVIMRKEDSIDIDTPEDWNTATFRKKTTPPDIKIAGKKIGNTHPIFIIAEAGVNHNGDIKLAKKLIDMAKECGADAVKFQTFNPLTGTSKNAEKTNYQKENDGTQGNYQTMLQKLQLNELQFIELNKYAKKQEILFMSTASDHESLDIVKKLNVPAFKIGSNHITNLPLLKDTAHCQKPIIMSVGMATYQEINEAIAIITATGNNDIILLHCVSQYPTPINNANLSIITKLKKHYPNINIGYSDHTLGNDASLASIALGACIIERHITLNKSMEGPDHKASLEKDELRELVSKAKRVKTLLGHGKKIRTPGEDEVAKKARRSIFVHTQLTKGTIITEENIRLKKPEIGIKPKYYWDVLGKKVKHNMEKDTPLRWEDISET
jgi:N,N'-diacetyllegionaminate synthase